MPLSIEELLLEKLSALSEILTGNGDPEKGLVISFTRMELKQDALLDKIDTHLSDKKIHRTKDDSERNMLKMALWLTPVALGAIVIIYLTLAGEWAKVGEIISGWLGV